MAREAYGTFRHPAVVPLAQIGAQPIRARAVSRPDARLQGRRDAADRAADGSRAGARGERTTIVVATSGDTGGAAVEAFRGRDNVDLFVLFPHGRISDVQRRMMTTRCDATCMRSRSKAPSTIARRS
jgi:threonine synthase